MRASFAAARADCSGCRRGSVAQQRRASPAFRGTLAEWRRLGSGEPYCRHFDTNTVTTISGEVVKVGRVKPLKEMGPGIHLELKTEGEPNVDVHLGPAWFIENQDTKILAGDRIQVKGSRTKIEGKPVLIASELRKNEDVLTLRDADGRPVWAGWRRSYGR